jgi:drug/metabolite transporter (DMT)-like permease
MSDRKNIIWGAISISTAATLWGLDGVVLTPRLYNLDVSFVVFILHALPFVIMHTFLYKQYRFLKVFTLQDISVLVLIALFGGAIGTISIVKALFLVNFKELSIVVLLQKLQPIFAIALAALILKERLSKYFILWAAIALLGGYFLTFGLDRPNLQTGSNTTLAAMYAMLAAFSFGSSTVFSKMILHRYSFKTATFYRYGITAVVMFIYVLFIGKLGNFAQTTTQNWIIFLVIAFTTGSGAIFLYYHGLNRVKAILAIMCELFFPISTILFDYLVNGNRLTIVQWISAAVMIYAIISLNRSQEAEIS